MRRLIVILWPCLLSSAINAMQIKEGEIKHFIEVFVKSRGNDSNGDLYFALTTYNESLSVFQTHESVERKDDSNMELPGYFPDNKTLGRIQTECFGREKITCGIDRDTGELETFDESEGKTFYMYRAFNFSVPWECSKRFCIFTNLLTGEEYEIPSDLKTFVGDAPGERIAMVPLLTIQSPLVVEQLKRYGNSASGIEGFWFTLVLVYFLRYMFE
ncbi:unnamed protein product [Bursaphelenchus xylophilus]|uniref:(pine wood nematode) hypothetical protein n=1 Tax=Bursaphelenchus xylophilus TaxID=6326 RepID=A0A1I7SF46_BURXY|nr:unnamed protein product [Bursaphelenchus xylophilus]CAG9078824.1 unnamed protein product [Bursaphelenchus xylophilus]